MFRIKDYFDDYISQQKVAKFLLETGLKVEGGKIYCNDVQMSPLRISRVLDMDRRTINATVKTIESNEDLKRIFENLRATAFLADVAQEIDAGLIEVIPEDPHGVGILSGVADIIADLDISIRQCITEDPEFTEEAKLYVITESSVPMHAVERIKDVQGVKSVTIY
ncbi:MAG: amino acid-binding protein [Elusimicrobiota bacterium]